MRLTLAELAGQNAPRENRNRHYYTVWADQPVSDVTTSAERWFAERSGAPNFFIAATRAALAAHQEAGAAIVLVSGSFAAPLVPIAAAVGAQHLVCARMETEAGRYTGRLIGQPVIGEHKRAAVHTLLTAYPHVSALACYGYGDHTSDLPLLQEVGHPVIVGNDADLISRLPQADILAPGNATSI
jgi:HAD superfamily hydrolase (TIGR01490 family)